MPTATTTLEKALSELRQGKMIILFDHEKRENEGDFILAAEQVTPEAINFMAYYGRGLICLALTEAIIERLQLPMMTDKPTNPFGTAFTVSIEAAQGVTTGISAADRAHTIKVAIDPKSTNKDLVMPGHVFPLKAKKLGVLERMGHTEGAIDLMRFAQLRPAAVICEIMNPNGHMAHLPDLQAFSVKHQLTLLSVQDIRKYRLRTECLVEELTSARLPTQNYGELTMKVFQSTLDKYHNHIALIKGKLPFSSTSPTLLRIHSECFTGDMFGSSRCDCGWQLHQSLSKISQEGGILLYLRQEGRGIGLSNKLKAYVLQDQGLDTVEANEQLGFKMDERTYWIGAHILRHFGISQVRLLTNNPKKISDLEENGITVQEHIPLIAKPNQENLNYLKTKKTKLGHWLDIL